MKYIMHQPHEPIMYSRNNIFKLNDIPHQYLFKSGSAEIKKTQEYSKFLHTYCYTNYASDLSDKRYAI